MKHERISPIAPFVNLNEQGFNEGSQKGMD